MDSALIVWAWLGGIVWGALLLEGCLTLVTGRVLFNPRRIDGSIDEGRLLGATYTVVCAIALVTMIQLAASVLTPQFAFLVMSLVGGAGMLAVIAIGRHHDARNPSKRFL